MVLCFWQRIRQCFRTPVIVFMDKLCIAQKDAHLKESGQGNLGRWEGVVEKIGPIRRRMRREDEAEELWK